jgi:hypothetical protein
MGGMARPLWPFPMGGTTRIFSPCAMSWADGLAHGQARHDTGRHGDTGGTEECRASMACPCRVLCRAGTVAIFRRGAADLRVDNGSALRAGEFPAVEVAGRSTSTSTTDPVSAEADRGNGSSPTAMTMTGSTPMSTERWIRQREAGSLPASMGRRSPSRGGDGIWMTRTTTPSLTSDGGSSSRRLGAAAVVARGRLLPCFSPLQREARRRRRVDAMADSARVPRLRFRWRLLFSSLAGPCFGRRPCSP